MIPRIGRRRHPAAPRSSGRPFFQGVDDFQTNYPRIPGGVSLPDDFRAGNDIGKGRGGYRDAEVNHPLLGDSAQRRSGILIGLRRRRVGRRKEAASSSVAAENPGVTRRKIFMISLVHFLTAGANFSRLINEQLPTLTKSASCGWPRSAGRHCSPAWNSTVARSEVHWGEPSGFCAADRALPACASTPSGKSPSLRD